MWEERLRIAGCPYRSASGVAPYFGVKPGSFELPVMHRHESSRGTWAEVSIHEIESS